MQTYTLCREWDDHESVILGYVSSSSENYARILEEWEKFKASEPDWDGEFVPWLVDTGAFTEVFVPLTNVVLQ